MTFIHTTALSIMNALCYVTPYLYYSALMSPNLSSFLVSVPNPDLSTSFYPFYFSFQNMFTCTFIV